MRSRFTRHVSTLLMFAALACTSDPEPTSDPVTEGGTDTTATDATGIPPAEEPIATDPPAATEDDTTGSLTDDPYGAPQPPQGSGDDAAAANGTAPVPTDDYGGAFESDLDSGTPESAGSTPPDTTVTSPGSKAGKKSKGSKHGKAGKSGKRVTRYVNATLLNVRSKPSPKAPIVRRLLGGAKVEVEIHGRFAKIKDGQWCHAKFLSESPTKKVTRSEVDHAWKNSKYKDNWKPSKK